MADDKDAFILIRNNRVHVLVNGGLLLQIRMHSQGGMVCEAHEDFLSLRNMSKPYAKLDDDSTEPISRVNGLNGLSKHYQKVKRRINLFTGKEKKIVQHFSLSLPQIIDLEIGLEDEKKKDASRKGAQRIDMAGISERGTLVFYEVKLFNNSEIRSKDTPMVVGQLKKYERLLQKFQDEILEGYEDEFKTYQKLKGSFFKNRSQPTAVSNIDHNVRLIITAFDGSQKEFLLPTILNGIRKGMNWDEKTPDLIAIGNHSSLKYSRMFKGIA